MMVMFIRHGPAEDRDSWPGHEFDRPLTEAGAQLVSRVGRRIPGFGMEPDRILTSPLARARQTAEIVAREAGWRAVPEPDERLAPGLDPRRLARILTENAGAAMLVLVGHEPDQGRLVSALIGGGAVKCRKGGIACVDLVAVDPPRGYLACLIPPGIMED